MPVILILNDIRSVHNVGSLLRTADGFGVERVFCIGITPHPSYPNDPRLPHIGRKQTEQLHKTALGAEISLEVNYRQTLLPLLAELRQTGYYIAAIEQSAESMALDQLPKDKPLAIVLGNELTGLDDYSLKACDGCFELPMLGHKESFNVSVCGAIALYEVRH